jgi:hypothetical protein
MGAGTASHGEIHLKIYLTKYRKFGHTFNLPACNKSRLLCGLIDKKTLQERHLQILIELGYEIEILEAG